MYMHTLGQGAPSSVDFRIMKTNLFSEMFISEIKSFFDKKRSGAPDSIVIQEVGSPWKRQILC